MSVPAPLPPVPAPPVVHRSPRWAAPIFFALGLVLIPWTLWLAVSLPTRQLASHYDAAWSGFDVALAASLAWHFADAHTQLAFAAEGYAGSREVMDFLRYLALIEAREGGSVLDSLEDSGDYNIILTSRSRGSLPTRLWSSSYILYMQDK